MVPATPIGLRDRAIIMTLFLSGRRRAEVLGITAGRISVGGEMVFYSYRGKGPRYFQPGDAAGWSELEITPHNRAGQTSS